MPQKQKPIMKWVDALKIWNRGSDKWCFVKKGTPEYDLVYKIFMGETLNNENKGMLQEHKQHQMPKQELENRLQDIKDLKPVIETATNMRVEQAQKLRTRLNERMFNATTEERKRIIYKLPEVVYSKRPRTSVEEYKPAPKFTMEEIERAQKIQLQPQLQNTSRTARTPRMTAPQQLRDLVLTGRLRPITAPATISRRPLSSVLDVLKTKTKERLEELKFVRGLESARSRN